MRCVKLCFAFIVIDNVSLQLSITPFRAGGNVFLWSYTFHFKSHYHIMSMSLLYNESMKVDFA